MKTIYLLLIFVILASCSSVKNNYSVETNNLKKTDKVKLKNMEIKTELAADMPGNQITLNSKIILANKDSLQMTVFAPFGLEVAKIFSDKKEFKLYNVFENSVTTGTPSPEALKNATGIDASFESLTSLLRSEVPGDISKYEYQGKTNESKDDIFINKTKADVVEYVILSNESGNILQYQQKNKEGKTLFNVYLRDYTLIDGFEIAKKIILKYPDINGEFVFNFDEVELNKPIVGNLNFKTPAGALKKTLD